MAMRRYARSNLSKLAHGSAHSPVAARAYAARRRDRRGPGAGGRHAGARSTCSSARSSTGRSPCRRFATAKRSSSTHACPRCSCPRRGSPQLLAVIAAGPLLRCCARQALRARRGHVPRVRVGPGRTERLGGDRTAVRVRSAAFPAPRLRRARRLCGERSARPGHEISAVMGGTEERRIEKTVRRDRCRAPVRSARKSRLLSCWSERALGPLTSSFLGVSVFRRGRKARPACVLPITSSARRR
jgi:hypothetical protein